MLKRFLFGSVQIPSFFSDLAVFFARALAGLSMAFGHGFGKMPPADRFVEGVARIGFPAPSVFAWAAALSEFLGGLLLAAGLLTRPSAFFIGFTMLVANLGVHASDPFERKELSLLYFAIALVFVGIGGGRLSLDRFFRGATAKVAGQKSKPKPKPKA